MAQETVRERLLRERRRRLSLMRTGERLGIDTSQFKPEESTFWKILEPFQRPQMAVFNFVNEFQTNPNATMETAIGHAWEGLKGDERTYFADILRNQGMKDGPLLVTLGLAGDIFAEPMNIVPVGMVSKLPESIRKIGLASERGRKLAYWWDTLWRDTSLNSIRKAAHAMFINRPDVSPEMARLFESSVVKEWETWKAADLGELSVRAERTKLDVTQVDRVANYFGLDRKGAAKAIEDADWRVSTLEAMRAGPTEHGKLPHVILGELLHKAEKNSRIAQALRASGYMEEMRRFFRDDLKGMSEGDMKRVMYYAEAAGMGPRAWQTRVGRLAKADRMTKALDGADDAERVRTAGQRLADMELQRFDAEDKLGLPTSMLGGIYPKKMMELRSSSRDEFAKIEEVVRSRHAGKIKATNETLRQMADGFEKFNWGTPKYNQDRDALVWLMRNVAKNPNGPSVDDMGILRRYIEGMMDEVYLESPARKIRAPRPGVFEPDVREVTFRGGEGGVPRVSFGGPHATVMKSDFMDVSPGVAKRLQEKMKRMGWEKIRNADGSVTWTGKGPLPEAEIPVELAKKHLGKVMADTKTQANRLRSLGQSALHTLSAHQQFIEDFIPKRITMERKQFKLRYEAKMRDYFMLQDMVPGYVRWSVSDDDARWILKNKRMRSNMMSDKHAALLHRAWVDQGTNLPLPRQTVEKILKAQESELNDLGASILKRRLTVWEAIRGKPAKLGEMFDADPIRAMLLRRQESVRAVGAHQFKDEIARLLGGYSGPQGSEMPAFGKVMRRVVESPEEMVGRPGWMTTTAKGREKLAMLPARFPTPLANLINDLEPAYTSPAAARDFMGIFSKMQAWWVGTTLLPWPAYHSRNFVGNLWNMALGGFFTSGVKVGRFWELPYDPHAFMDFANAAHMQRLLTSGDEAALHAMRFNFNGVNMTGAEVVNLARRHGVVDNGLWTTFWKASAEQSIKAKGGLLGADGRPSLQAAKEAIADGWDLPALFTPGGSARQPIMRLGKEVARGIENHARLSYFINRLRKGDDAVEAATNTAHWLIDYSDVTPFHAQVLRGAFPFATWTMKNIPLQLEGLLSRPTQFTALEKVTRAMGSPGSPMLGVSSMLAERQVHGVAPEDQAGPMDLPAWMKRMAPFELGRDDQGNIEIGTLGGWIPAADLDRVHPQNILRTPLDMLTPLLKVPLETFSERSFFYDRDLKGTSEFAGFEMNAKVANALTSIRAASEFDRLNLLAGTTFATRRLRPETDDTIKQRVARLLTGIKVYPTDARKARLYNLKELNNALSQEVAKERRVRSREGLAMVQRDWERMWGHRE